MIFSYILIFLLLLFIIFLLTSFLTPLFSKVPFVPVRGKIVNEIISILDLKEDSVLYDLGCGDGRVLFAGTKYIKSVKAVGIEHAPFPYICAKLRKFFSKSKNVSIIYGDFFKLNITPASHIFLYLFPSILDDLLPKFEKELKHGTKVFSCDFEFSKRKPNKVIDIKSKNWQTNRKIYVYYF
ncbi:MAG: SAM-dependent methyltransferase [Candidatus Nomurabacteria bacterium]|nr:SAM-dependent methyltransferase [Candidatus Nomurabacteria bacterium]